jgi:hypothetical protein
LIKRDEPKTKRVWWEGHLCSHKSFLFVERAWALWKALALSQLNMKLTAYGLLLLSLAAIVLCEKSVSQEIIQLTDGNFDSIVGTSDEWLVEL